MRSILLLITVTAALTVPTALAEDAGPVTVNVDGCSNNAVAVSVNDCAVGLVAVSVFGPAASHLYGVAVSGTGSADGSTLGASGTGQSSGLVAAASGWGRADSTSGPNGVSVSGTGSAAGRLLGVSGTDRATGAVAASVTCAAAGQFVEASPGSGIVLLRSSGGPYTVADPFPVRFCL